MPFTPPPLDESISDRVLARLRYYWSAGRHRQLRGVPMRLSPGTEVLLSRDARIEIQSGFVARRDLTLSVQGGTLHIGKRMFCNRGAMLSCMRQIVIGDDVRLGERVSVIDHNHVTEPLEDHQARFEAFEAAPIEIGNRVLIGANCVVLAGARIGDDSVIGAGSIVRGDIPSGALAVGVPAVVKRELTRDEVHDPAGELPLG